MNESLTYLRRAALILACALPAALLLAPTAHAQGRTPARTADYVVAVVNQELVTAVEVAQRAARMREELQRVRQPVPPEAELRRLATEALIEERVIVTYARDSGMRVEEPELDRAVASVAQQNQITLAQLRERLRTEGMDYTRFRSNVKDQLMVERTREREVQSRIRVSDEEVDALIAKQRNAAMAQVEYNIAQILVLVREGAPEAEVAERRARAEGALARVRGGEPFDAVAKQVSEDGNRERGGEIGMRPSDRLPELFVDVVSRLKPGETSPTLLKSGAGFHVLKLIDRRDGQALRVTQTHARHILLRPNTQVASAAALKRLAEFKRAVQGGQRRFDELAREFSEDGSAPQGGDLGWTSPGAFVPEFEQAMNALPVGGLSDPVVSRFGVHLIQVIERRDAAVDLKQLREQARAQLREQRFDEAYADWVRELRARAYIEMREPPA